MSSSPPPEAECLPCPRCNSRDTKFCYFNNYSTAQPRHFCKNCKRYWTAGGSLRNVPVGGGLRKSKKSKLSKHGKDLLCAYPEEFLSPGKPAATSLLLASPSSSADGVVDETFATPVVPLLAYRPTFEFASESLDPRDCTPLPASHHFDYMNFTQSCEDHENALPAKSHHRHAQDARNGFQQPQSWYGSVDQAPCNYGETSAEPLKESYQQPTVLSSMHTRYPSLQRYPEHERREHKAQLGAARQIFQECRTSSKQGNAEEHTLSHDGIPRSTNVSVAKEDEDEGLGNVINVRYPYDWEQVSEVLSGGTPDFFHMPTF